MPLDFPNSPTVNQEFTANGITWKYDGVAWNIVSGGSGFRVSSGAPSSPALGDLWYESDSGEMFIYYDNQWVSPAVLATVGTSAIGTQQLASSAVTAQKALTSAASTITGTNSSGVSNALARADHNHALGAGVVGSSQLGQSVMKAGASLMTFNTTSTATASISHGLGTTPTSVVATADREQGGGIAILWNVTVGNFSSTTFTAQVTSIDGSVGTSAKVYWIATAI